MKILYIQHTSVLGGSSRSLLEVITNLPKDVEPNVLCPKGDFADLLKEKGVQVYTVRGIPQFDNTRISYYRKFRWLILLRELFFMPFLFLKILNLKKEKYNIVHINEITQIYSIVLSKLFIGYTVVHVRSMQAVKKNFRYKVLLKILKKYADSIIAIDKSVKNTLDSSLNVNVVHNGMSIDNIALKKNKMGKFTVGIVSNFQRYKGILEFIDAANICITKSQLDINFSIFGAAYVDTKSIKEYILQFFGFREDMDTIIKKKLENYAFRDHLKLEGYVDSPNDIYNSIDLLVFPSHLNAAGRPVFEAGFYKIPSIVAIENELDDTIVNGVTGICIKEKNAIVLAEAIEKLYVDRDLLLTMGDKSYKLSNALYDSKQNSMKIYSIYKGFKLS